MFRALSVLVLVVSLTLAGSALGAWQWLAPGPSETVSGLLLEGAPIGRGEDPRRAVRARSEAWLEGEVWLEAGPLTERLRRSEVGLTIDIEACARSLVSIGRSGEPIADLLTRLRAHLGRVRVTLAPQLDEAALRAALEAIAARFDREPVGAELDPEGRLVTPPAPGRAIDVEASVRAIAAGLAAGERRFSLIVTARPVPVDPARVARARAPVVIGSYLTRYRMRGDEGPRAVNVRVAAEALDGAVIAPGERFSFNAQVGPRTPGRGYRVAHVIYDGEMIDGIGGGVCQVASTLHAAAFLAGLPILDQVPHSRPSSYIPMGLDATVVYPDVDLVVANPLSVPITVRAHADAGRLAIELWARARPAEVEWRREILARTSYDERLVEDPALPAGELVVSQEGGPGFVVERLRVLHAPSGDAIERRLLRYPPTDRVVRVAPGSMSLEGEPSAQASALGSGATTGAPSAVESPLGAPASDSIAGAATGLASVPGTLE